MNTVWEQMTNEDLCVEYQKTNNDTLFEYLLNRNKPLIYRFLRRCLNLYYTDKDEIMANAYTCFWQAVCRFDSSKNTKFSTYVYYYMRKAFLEYIRSNNVIRIPAYILQHYKIHEEEITNNRCISLNEYIEGIDDDQTELIDSFVDDRVIHSDNLEDIEHSGLKKLLSTLSPRDQVIMEYHLGLRGDYHLTFEEIAEKYNLTRERIRQLVVKAIKKLRKKAHLYLDTREWTIDDAYSGDKIYTSKRNLKKHNKK